MHSPGVEPGLSAWKADIIPLDQECQLKIDLSSWNLILIYFFLYIF